MKDKDKLYLIKQAVDRIIPKEYPHGFMVVEGNVYRGYEDDDNRRNKYYIYNYGISLKEYNAILKDQGYQCDICGVFQNEIVKHMSVDHNHDTSEVRGLLCSNCNSLLGFAKDDINILQNAIEYISKHNS